MRSLPHAGIHLTLLFYGLQSLFPEVSRFHRGEPLLGSPEYYRGLAPPAVRVRVPYVLFQKKGAVRPQELDYRFVGLEDMHARELRDDLHELAAVVDRVVDVEAVLQAELVVVLAVSRRCVYAACAGLESYMLAGQDDGVPVYERVAGLHAPLWRRSGRSSMTFGSSHPSFFDTSSRRPSAIM